MEWMGYAVSVAYGAVLLSLAFVLYKVGLAKLYTRKIVHIGVGFEFFILNHYFPGSIHFIIVCLGFTVALLLNYRLRILRMMESDGENDPGSIYYGVSMLILSVITYFFPSYTPYFGAAVLLLSVGDGMAGIVGASIKRHNVRLYRNKSLFGTLGMLLCCTLSMLIYRPVMDIDLYLCLAVSLFATGCEALSRAGRDNLHVPLLSFLFLVLCEHFSFIRAGALGIALTPLLIVLMLAVRKLTVGGAIAAAVINLCVCLSLGDFGFLMLILYFSLAAFSDKLKREESCSLEQKGSCRDEIQVLSNGFAAAGCALLFWLTASRIFLIGFAIALAESLGDTVASGLGSYASRTFDAVRRTEVVRGTSGGVSLVGSLSALGAIILFCSAFFAVFGVSAAEIALSSFFASLGVFLDSILGATLQARYRCVRCGRIGEWREHCGVPTVRVRGIEHCDNDFVNLISSLISVLLGTCTVFFLLY